MTKSNRIGKGLQTRYAFHCHCTHEIFLYHFQSTIQRRDEARDAARQSFNLANSIGFNETATNETPVQGSNKHMSAHYDRYDSSVAKPISEVPKANPGAQRLSRD